MAGDDGSELVERSHPELLIQILPDHSLCQQRVQAVLELQ